MFEKTLALTAAALLTWLSFLFLLKNRRFHIWGEKTVFKMTHLSCAKPLKISSDGNDKISLEPTERGFVNNILTKPVNKLTLI